MRRLKQLVCTEYLGMLEDLAFIDRVTRNVKAPVARKRTRKPSTTDPRKWTNDQLQAAVERLRDGKVEGSDEFNTMVAITAEATYRLTRILQTRLIASFMAQFDKQFNHVVGLEAVINGKFNATVGKSRSKRGFKSYYEALKELTEVSERVYSGILGGGGLNHSNVALPTEARFMEAINAAKQALGHKTKLELT